ncbi:MAG TPA: hypothetical protein VHE35_10010 [Kofleriaceae bacterium]|nr:hypothetical protein [Kofleriaceae bacterium]
MSPSSHPRATLPTARLVERSHRLADLPAPPLRASLERSLAPLAAASRDVAAMLVGLWPLTAIALLAAALVASAAT